MEQKPIVELINSDGNALSIIATCRKAARKAGWTNAEWKAVQDEMMSGDYDHLLQTAMKHFEVR